MPENYDQRRSRCMLDQSSNTQNPVHLILRSPYTLQTEYGDVHQDVRSLLGAYNALAARETPATGAREALAQKVDALSSRYATAYMSALAEHLSFFAELLRGYYPMRPVMGKTELEEIP